MNEIISRITTIMEEQQVSSAAFADTIGVQRSSISHVLSGRNKPSLDFILKIISAFPSYSADWLLFGKSPTSDVEASRTTSVEQEQILTKPIDRPVEAPEPPPLMTNDTTSTNQTAIDKVVLLLNDGSFTEYVAKKE